MQGGATWTRLELMRIKRQLELPMHIKEKF
jgi:hypothetical protein